MVSEKEERKEPLCLPHAQAEQSVRADVPVAGGQAGGQHLQGGGGEGAAEGGAGAHGAPAAPGEAAPQDGQAAEGASALGPSAPWQREGPGIGQRTY